MLRMRGDLLPIKFRDLAATELNAYIGEIITASQRERLAGGLDLDFSYVTADGTRFRANVFHKASGVGAVLRHIPNEIPSLKKLKLPPVITKLCDSHQGMILVTGATGTGKSTTLASMIDFLNESRRLNILTLEDPIEFVHPSKKSQVIQREVGTHLKSFSDGLRAALREDPDVILVGEMRDPETISMAMTAAETGHLVLGTMHTTGAVKTVDRVLDALPAELREQTKSFLSQGLNAVVSQVLLKTPDQRGRRAVQEIMVSNRAIAKLIAMDQTHQIPSILQTGRDQGMQTMDQALLDAVKRKEVDPDEAYLYASNKAPFERYVTDLDLLPQLPGEKNK
jgi:twitching motility protein PilT